MTQKSKQKIKHTGYRINTNMIIMHLVWEGRLHCTFIHVLSGHHISYVYIHVFMVSFKTVSDLWSAQTCITGFTSVVRFGRQTSRRFYTVPFTHNACLIS